MIKEKIDFFRKIMVFADGAAVAAAFFAAFFLRQTMPKDSRFDLLPFFRVLTAPPTVLNGYWTVLVILVPLWILALSMSGMYKPLRTERLSGVLWMIAKSVLLVFVGLGAALFVFNIKFVSRLFIFFFLVIGASALAVERTILHHALRVRWRRGHMMRRLLIVGTGRQASRFIETIRRHQEYGFQIVGLVEDEAERRVGSVKGIDVIGTLADFPDILYRRVINEVVFAVPRKRLSRIENAITACETEGVSATLVIDLFNLKIARSRLTELDGVPLVTFETTMPRAWHRFVKRLFDIAVSGLGIMVLSPAFFAIGALIRLTSRGPAIFKQERVGLNGRRFVLYKFRTMRRGAEKMRFELESRNEMNGPVFKIKDDPRVTPVGRALRRFSLDELPQLVNVFAGHMSLVGPRALPVYEVNKLRPWQRRRLSMRPGLTCLWQIKGRNRVDFEDWMKLDLEYLDHWSMRLDFTILLRTIPSVLFGIGAY